MLIQEKIQKRLILGLKYLRIARRLTVNEITERTGINIYLIETGLCVVSLRVIIKLQEVFGARAMSNLLNNTFQDGGIWTEEVLAKLILDEQIRWETEKLQNVNKYEIDYSMLYIY